MFYIDKVETIIQGHFPLQSFFNTWYYDWNWFMFFISIVVTVVGISEFCDMLPKFEFYKLIVFSNYFNLCQYQWVSSYDRKLLIYLSQALLNWIKCRSDHIGISHHRSCNAQKKWDAHKKMRCAIINKHLCIWGCEVGENFFTAGQIEEHSISIQGVFDTMY